MFTHKMMCDNINYMKRITYKINKLYKSIKGHILLLILCLFLVLIILLFIVSQYLFQVAKESIIQTSKNKIKIYKEEVENNLHSLDSQLKDIGYNIYKSKVLNINDSELYFAKNEIYAILKSRIQLDTDADNIFVLSEENEVFINHKSTRLSTKNNLEISNYVKAKTFPIASWTDNDWNLIEIDEQYYFFLAKSVNNITVVFVSQVSTVFHRITDSDHEKQIVATDLDGNVKYSVNHSLDFDKIGNDEEIRSTKEYWFITEKIDGCGIRITEILHKKNNTFLWNGQQVIIPIFMGLAILLLLILWRYLSKNVVKPIYQLADIMNHIKDDNFGTGINETEGPQEIKVLNQSYNRMMNEIANLKITEYESKLDLQEERLKGLLMQIKPHFYLNAISTIYSMTYQDKNEDIRIFIAALSKHLRYMMINSFQDVSLNDELNHITNYIEMQQVRFPERIFYYADVDHSVDTRKIMIPRLLLHTVLENCFKYALNPYEMLTILIHVKKIKEQNKLCIIIEDNGEGFKDEFLKSFSLEDSDYDKKKIGLKNIQKTILLKYGSDSSLNLENTVPHGARVTIIIPESR